MKLKIIDIFFNKILCYNRKSGFGKSGILRYNVKQLLV